MVVDEVIFDTSVLKPSPDDGEAYRLLHSTEIVFPLDNIWEDPPETVLLGSLRDGRLRISEPIRIKFFKENEDTVAEVEEFNEFGFGKNWCDAMIDLQRAIAELYFALEEEKDNLGPELRNTRQELLRHIRMVAK